MPETLKKLRIFAASPSDVASERAKLETVVDSLKPMANYLGLTLEVVDWCAVVPDTGRPQQIIFDQLKPTSWDIFIGILWHRFGTPPGAKDKDGKDYLAGTEEEFKTAYELWKQYNKPRIVLYRCTRAFPFDIDPDQLKHVRTFFNLIEDVKGNYPTLYQVFDTTESFEKLVLDNLQKLLIEYGEQSKISITPEVVQVLAPKIPNNLPRRQAFFGRNKEMEIVMRSLSPADRTWGVLVDGIGGIGKSAIAIEAAYRSQEASSFDAFVFITAKQNILEPNGMKDLNPVALTLDEFLNETARVLGQPGIAKLTGDEKRHALIEMLRSLCTLIIYDNLETLSKEEQEAIADFLRELPQGCKAIITSRRRGGEGSVWLRVGKLDWDAAYGIIENEVSRDAGLSSKLHRFKKRWLELYDETNGSPLALVHILGLLRVRAALTFEGALSMLRGLHRNDDLVKFVYQEARKELTANDKIALSSLSFFVPSATFKAWTQVAGLSRSALEASIDRLSALSLVDVLMGEESYGLHPLTRVYVQEDLLVDKQMASDVEGAFLRYWSDFVDQNGYENYESYYLLEAEWANIKAALDWALNKIVFIKSKIKDVKTANIYLSMSWALWKYLWLWGRWDESQEIHTNAYYISFALNYKSHAGWMAYYVAWIDGLYGRNNPNKVKPWAEKCIKGWSQTDEVILEIESVRLRGLISMQFRRFKLAERFLKKALSMARNSKEEYTTMVIINDLGKLAFEQEKYDVAKRYYKKALAIAIKIKSKEGQAFANTNLADVDLKQTNFLVAGQNFKRALPAAQKVGRVDLIARIKYGLALVWQAKGDLYRALQSAKEGSEYYKSLQHPNLRESQDLVQMLEVKIAAVASKKQAKYKRLKS